MLFLLSFVLGSPFAYAAPDRDGDGIPDKRDQCPDAWGSRDAKGCGAAPAFSDSDGDGLEDAVDRCPDWQEDVDGFQDDDGCPDMDNDGDGIEDPQDACPRDPEDRDGVDDADGCPDPDAPAPAAPAMPLISSETSCAGTFQGVDPGGPATPRLRFACMGGPTQAYMFADDTRVPPGLPAVGTPATLTWYAVRSAANPSTPTLYWRELTVGGTTFTPRTLLQDLLEEEAGGHNSEDWP